MAHRLLNPEHRTKGSTMPTIAEAVEAEKLAALVAVVKGSDKARTKATPDIVVTKAATDPTVGVSLPRSSSEVDLDPESEAMIDALCHTCSSRISIDPTTVLDLDPEVDTPFHCGVCVKHSMVEAIVAQRNVETIKRGRVAKHQPRVTDNIDHPVTTTRKETRVFDVDNMTDAEIGATVRARLKENLAKQVAKRKPAVEQARVEAEVARSEGIATEQERRSGHVLPGFMVGTSLEVPALDLSDVSSLDESPSAVQRSPYNKARFRLKAGETLSPETTTYRVLEMEHHRLAVLAEAHNARAALDKADKTEAKVNVVVADVHPEDDAMARLEALVATLRK